MEKRNLERQIKELNKEKAKLMDIIEKSQGRVMKDKQKNEKRLEKYEKIMEKKISTPAEILCKGFPQELATFINYARNLKF